MRWRTCSAFPTGPTVAPGRRRRLHRAVSLIAGQFHHSFGNALTAEESKQRYERWTIPAPGKPLLEAAEANFSPHSPAEVNTGNKRGEVASDRAYPAIGCGQGRGLSRYGGTTMAKPDPSTQGPDGLPSQPGEGRIALPVRLQRHPVVLEMQARRAADRQLRIADWITAFAGSMNFVYLHVALFAVWMLFLESKPWPTLTLIVSLEAIFLSTFVMIGQNRQAAFAQAKADHDFNEQELELKTNTQLTREIHRLTTELYRRVTP